MTYYYHSFFRVDGYLWYHSISKIVPSPEKVKYFLQTPMPLIHNYGLTLELAGFLVDYDVGYVSLFGKTSYKSPIEIFKKLGIYSYPAITTKPLLREVFMSGKGESYLEVKSQGRLAYPDTAKLIMLKPGSELEALIISEEKIPRYIVLRIGAKRFGVLRAKLEDVNIDEVHDELVTHPYNIRDVVNVHNKVTVLKHNAGDIAIFGIAERAYKYKVRISSYRSKTVVVPALKLV